MRTTSIVLAAVAAAFLSTSAFAVPPSAQQVTVPAGAETGRHEARMNALFASPEERMMFRMQIRDQTKGMARADKKAYRKQQMQKVRAMNNSEKAAWRHGLDAQWAALPAEKRNRMEAKFQRHEAKHEAHQEQRHGGQGMDQPPPPQQ